MENKMLAQFKNEKAAENFMMYLMNQNNQGVIQVLYKANGLYDVEYIYNHIIHNCLIERVNNYLAINSI